MEQRLSLPGLSTQSEVEMKVYVAEGIATDIPYTVRHNYGNYLLTPARTIQPALEESTWGSSADPTGPVPDTGVTRYYNFTVSRGKKSPDGVSKNMILVNDQFPGPLIEANWGDVIQVTVHNSIGM